ncbi:hypothetical protein [Streptomyces sp. NPDC051567]|uniref:hypothetical protein n=1 Tax=Streptomyces sp. NPDC051567 TaxID=3365660 RepID=UPI0037BD9477
MRPPTRNRAGLIALIALLFTTFGMPNAAPAAPRAFATYERYIGLDYVISPNSTIWVHSVCPSGTRPSGGGGYNDEDSVYMVASVPSLIDNAWYAQFVNPTSNRYGRVHAVAICTNAQSYAHELRRTASPYDYLTMTSWCAPNERLSGGGFRAWDSRLRANATFPVNSVTQQVTVTNATGSNIDVSAYAVCGFDQYATRGASSSVQGYQSGTAQAYCSSREVRTGGGGYGNSFNDIQIQYSSPTDSGWVIRGKNLSGAPQNLQASVLCAPL